MASPIPNASPTTRAARPATHAPRRRTWLVLAMVKVAPRESTHHVAAAAAAAAAAS